MYFVYVEDDATSRVVMEMILKHSFGNAQVSIFEDSENFPERLDNLPAKPNIIFLDIHVAPYDGFEMLNMLRQHPDFSDCIVVALTASVMSEEIERLGSAGFDGAIAKPLNREQFPKLLEKILDGEEVWYVN